MSWPDLRAAGRRRALAAIAAAGALGACGFRPLYETGGGALHGQVALDGAEGRLGWHFRERMRRRLGDPGPTPAYRLDVALAFEQTGLAITPDDDVTRFDVFGRAAFTLRRAADRADLTTGEVRSVSAYSATSSPYATRTAERDAERRVAEDLADRVFARLAALRLDAST